MHGMGKVMKSQRVACRAGPRDEMHEALVFICARAVSAGREESKREQVMQCLLKAPQLLPWYIEELLRNFSDEVVSAVQVRAGWLSCLRAEHSVRRAMHVRASPQCQHTTLPSTQMLRRGPGRSAAATGLTCRRSSCSGRSGSKTL